MQCDDEICVAYLRWNRQCTCSHLFCFSGFSYPSGLGSFANHVARKIPMGDILIFTLTQETWKKEIIKGVEGT